MLEIQKLILATMSPETTSGVLVLKARDKATEQYNTHTTGILNYKKKGNKTA